MCVSGSCLLVVTGLETLLKGLGGFLSVGLRVVQRFHFLVGSVERSLQVIDPLLHQSDGRLLPLHLFRVLHHTGLQAAKLQLLVQSLVNHDDHHGHAEADNHNRQLHVWTETRTKLLLLLLLTITCGSFRVRLRSTCASCRYRSTVPPFSCLQPALPARRAGRVNALSMCQCTCYLPARARANTPSLSVSDGNLSREHLHFFHV